MFVIKYLLLPRITENTAANKIAKELNRLTLLFLTAVLHIFLKTVDFSLKQRKREHKSISIFQVLILMYRDCN